MSGNYSVHAIRRGLPVAVGLLSIAGCGGTNPPPAAPVAADRALLESAERPLQRAHEAEAISAGRKSDLDEKLEQAE